MSGAETCSSAGAAAGPNALGIDGDGPGPPISTGCIIGGECTSGGNGNAIAGDESARTPIDGWMGGAGGGDDAIDAGTGGGRDANGARDGASGAGAGAGAGGGDDANGAGDDANGAGDDASDASGAGDGGGDDANGAGDGGGDDASEASGAGDGGGDGANGAGAGGANDGDDIGRASIDAGIGSCDGVSVGATSDGVRSGGTMGAVDGDRTTPPAGATDDGGATDALERGADGADGTMEGARAAVGATDGARRADGSGGGIDAIDARVGIDGPAFGGIDGARAPVVTCVSSLLDIDSSVGSSERALGASLMRVVAGTTLVGEAPSLPGEALTGDRLVGGALARSPSRSFVSSASAWPMSGGSVCAVAASS